MYQPAAFVESRPEELQRLLHAHPLGAIVCQTESGLDANHLPFEYLPDEGPSGTLRAHIARANPLLRSAQAGADVLVIFRGLEGYVSPNWYPSKQETHRQVPTWNYEVVHAHGRLRLVDDEKFLRGVLARLTRQHEAAEPQPWRMGEAPPDYLAQMLSMVVGIEVQVQRLQGKRKLSQNKAPADIAGVVQGLQTRGQRALAEAVRAAGR